MTDIGHAVDGAIKRKKAKEMLGNYNRSSFTEYQVSEMRKEFKVNQYIQGIDRRKLADRIGLADHQVQIWFQNRRNFLKKDRRRCLKKQQLLQHKQRPKPQQQHHHQQQQHPGLQHQNYDDGCPQVLHDQQLMPIQQQLLHLNEAEQHQQQQRQRRQQTQKQQQPPQQQRPHSDRILEVKRHLLFCDTVPNIVDSYRPHQPAQQPNNQLHYSILDDEYLNQWYYASKMNPALQITKFYHVPDISKQSVNEYAVF